MADTHILFFLPAYNEATTIERVLEEVPAQVRGHRVRALVVDDGSTDETAAVAARAGAEVVSLGRNRGLGAAVRVGIAEGVASGAVATVFCDADGEYRPGEMAALVGPILDGRADYVVGSRFRGHIESMRLHRRVGNLLLTIALSGLANRRISDGQSGYRALGQTAAANAEIEHDYNYAQVLTLDLLGKGCRYEEVPISYRFRTDGESFVQLWPYVRHVVPAVWRVRRRWPQSSTTWSANDASDRSQAYASTVPAAVIAATAAPAIAST